MDVADALLAALPMILSGSVWFCVVAVVFSDAGVFLWGHFALVAVFNKEVVISARDSRATRQVTRHARVLN